MSSTSAAQFTHVDIDGIGLEFLRCLHQSRRYDCTFPLGIDLLRLRKSSTKTLDLPETSPTKSHTHSHNSHSNH